MSDLDAQIYENAAIWLFEDKNPLANTSCNAIHGALVEEHLIDERLVSGELKKYKNEFAKFFKPNPNCGPWWFEFGPNCESSFETEKEHRCLSLLLMAEMLRNFHNNYTPTRKNLL